MKHGAVISEKNNPILSGGSVNFGGGVDALASPSEILEQVFIAGNGEWFFSTSAGIEFGPFDSEGLAKSAFSVFEDWMGQKNKLDFEPGIVDRYMEAIKR